MWHCSMTCNPAEVHCHSAIAPSDVTVRAHASVTQRETHPRATCAEVTETPLQGRPPSVHHHAQAHTPPRDACVQRLQPGELPSLQQVPKECSRHLAGLWCGQQHGPKWRRQPPQTRWHRPLSLVPSRAAPGNPRHHAIHATWPAAPHARCPGSATPACGRPPPGASSSSRLCTRFAPACTTARPAAAGRSACPGRTAWPLG